MKNKVSCYSVKDIVMVFILQQAHGRLSKLIKILCTLYLWTHTIHGIIGGPQVGDFMHVVCVFFFINCEN